MEPWIWSVGGVLIVSIGWLAYLARIPGERVPEKPTGTALVMGIGTAASLVPLLHAVVHHQSPAALAVLAAAVSAGLAGFFLWLLREAQLPDGALAVAVGDRLLPFSAADTQGGRQGPADWEGRRVLFKLFRGHW